MIRTKALVACLTVAILAGSGAGLAAEEPPELTPLPPIDWRDFIDTDMTGDHVVGEELCAAPGIVESVPKSFVFI